MKIKTSADRSASDSVTGKGSTETTPQRSPPSTNHQPPPNERQSPRFNQSPAVNSSDVQGLPGSEDALEASTDFARNVRGTSTPIDVSPDVSKNRSQTFESERTSADTPSDANDRKPTDTVDTIDTQQIELSVVDVDHSSHSRSTGGNIVTESLPSP